MEWCVEAGEKQQFLGPKQWINVSLRTYMFRVVVPRRDYRRIEWLSEVLKGENFAVLYVRVDRLFDERADLDSIEIAFLLRGDAKARREMERRLAESLRGSIGFFVSCIRKES